MLPSLLFAGICGATLSLGAEDWASSPPLQPSHVRGHGGAAWAGAYASARQLVGQMTLEEKVNVTGGFNSTNVCSGNAGSVPRLGWPGMCLQDAGNGVRATDLVNSYPSGLHVGASWDRNLTYQRAWYMAKEFKAKGVNIILGPNAGPLGRTPLGGRNWEGFSVDPYLSGQLNAETIVGHQEAGVIANLKHLIGNEQETYRRHYHGVEAASSNIDDRTLRELYLWPFVDGVRAGVASVMCSYNRVNGTYACANGELLNGILKTELGFDGFVMLDWHAGHYLNSSNAGLDMVMPDQGAWGASLVQAVRDGSVSEERVTDMATRILAAWYLVGQDKDFPPPGIGIQNLTEPHEQVDARIPESQPIILEGAIAGHVLLKNELNTLPLGKPTMLSVYGYDAVAPRAKNTDLLFQLGYESSAEMGNHEPGDKYRFDQAARGGTLFTGGRAGANAPAYIIDPLNAIQYRARRDGTWVNWDVDSLAPDVNAASDACLVFINAMATEGWDRTGLRDDASDDLVRHVASRCARTVVVVHAAGIRVLDPWVAHPNVTAVVAAHLPGQDSGEALVRLLYGDDNFSGKLPYTVARREEDYPVLAPCEVKHEGDADPQCDYDEGVYIDYRAFDARDLTPRYEFGYGLSYTTFSYSAPSIQPIDLSAGSHRTLDELFAPAVTVTCTIRNTGDVAGAEVAQLYLGIPDSPPRQLRGFDKVRLGPGEAGAARFELTRRDLSVWDVETQRWVVQEGSYGVFVGASSRDVRLEGEIEVEAKGADVVGDGEL